MSDWISIKTRFDVCTGCSLCQLACTERYLGGYNPHRALLSVAHRSENLYHFPSVCHQCGNAYCANVCPTNAIRRNETTGAWVVDPETCIGCGLCVRYCPVGMARLDPDTGKSVKCDLCGGEPACVAACPTGALELTRTVSTHEISETGTSGGTP
ncbi:MAG: 4Fe-4S dicluster domain-containing protein [Desulfobacterales bacterium]